MKIVAKDKRYAKEVQILNNILGAFEVCADEGIADLQDVFEFQLDDTQFNIFHCHIGTLMNFGLIKPCEDCAKTREDRLEYLINDTPRKWLWQLCKEPMKECFKDKVEIKNDWEL